MGRPIIPHEAMRALGEQGDVGLFDYGQYLIGLRSPAVNKAISFHCFFDRGLGALRFTWRLDGLPWWGAAIVSRVGGGTRSPFITLAARPTP